LDHLTPYPNTRALAPNASLAVQSGSVQVRPYPVAAEPPIAQDAPLEEKGAALAERLVDAVWPASVVPDVQLFLSGGKDSRTLACALSKFSACRINAFTTGAAEQPEAQIAHEVAEALSCSHRFRKQRAIADPLRGAALSNLVTDGLGINFAHQFSFEQELSDLQGLPSFHGHGHLLRGGFARTMERDPATLNRTFLSALVSRYVNEYTTYDEQLYLEQWRDARSASFRDSRDLLFFANLDFRLGLFSASSSMDLTSRTFMVYPLLDERVAQFAASLAVFDRVSERVLYSALVQLNRPVSEVPLFGEIWRFDRSPEKRDFADSNHNFQDGYERRQPRQSNKLSNLSPDGDALVYDMDWEELEPNAKVVASYIRDSRLWKEWTALLKPEILAEIEFGAWAGRSSPTLRSRARDAQFNINSFIKRVFIASTLVDMSW